MKKLIALSLALLSVHCLAESPLTILGLNSKDRFLSSFWSANNTASNAVAGINANSTIRFSDSLLPLLISGKTIYGTFTGTNSFAIQTYNAVGTRYETYSFDWSSSSPSTTNTVSRTGMPEPLLYKTLWDARFHDGSDYLTGILRANGSSYADVITGWSGTNRVYIGGTNYFTLVDGVVTAFSGTTNIGAIGISSLNGQSGAIQTFAVGSSGTDVAISSSGDTHTFNFPNSSATNRGVLNPTDWSTFNSKQPGDATLTALAAFNSNGLIAQVSENTFAARTIVSGDGSLEIVNGDGVSGDIDVRLSGLMFYIPSDSSAPVGDPDAYAGKAAMIYDTNAHRLWIFDGGAWRYVATSTP